MERAIDEETDHEVRAGLKRALVYAYEAEDLIAQALRIESSVTGNDYQEDTS